MVRWNASKFAQLRIQMRALEQVIKAAEKDKDTHALSALYRRRTKLAKEIEEMAKARGKD